MNLDDRIKKADELARIAKNITDTVRLLRNGMILEHVRGDIAIDIKYLQDFLKSLEGLT